MRCDNILFTFLQLFFLEERRRQCLQDLAALIQKIYRGWKCRSHFLLLKSSQIVVAAWYRRYAVSPFTGMNVVRLLEEEALANYHLTAKRQLLSPLLPFFDFVISATNEIPEDQARHHLGAVLHQRLAGERLRPPKVRLRRKKRVIRGFLCLASHQARKLLRELKYQKRCEEAATTIAAYWHGTQVLELWRGELIITAIGLRIHLSV